MRMCLCATVWVGVSDMFPSSWYRQSKETRQVYHPWHFWQHSRNGKNEYWNEKTNSVGNDFNQTSPEMISIKHRLSNGFRLIIFIMHAEIKVRKKPLNLPVKVFVESCAMSLERRALKTNLHNLCRICYLNFSSSWEQSLQWQRKYQLQESASKRHGMKETERRVPELHTNGLLSTKKPRLLYFFLYLVELMYLELCHWSEPANQWAQVASFRDLHRTTETRASDIWKQQ